MLSFMLKSALVICSLVCCAGALFASPPSAQEAAEWKGVVLRSADNVARSAVSIAFRALPSAGDVARYAESTRLRAKSLVQAALRHFREPEPPLPQAQGARAWISLEDIECPPEAAMPRPWCDPRVQAVLQLLEEDRLRRGDSAQSFCSVGLPAPSALCE